MKLLLIILLFPLLAFSQHEDEFVGPFSSWLNVSDFGATGNGTTDDRAALQTAFDAIGEDLSIASVVYLPAGTYRITGTLRMNFKLNVAIIGADPATTIILWDGAANDTMLQINGTRYSRFNRITFDGNGVASVGVDQSWDASQAGFDTGNEYADDVFLDLNYGIFGGGLGNGFAETAIVRNKFYRCTEAGVSLGNFNALDIWVWDSYFEDCYMGVTNVFGAGNFKVYRSIFKGSTFADIYIGNTGEFAFRDNWSLDSKKFIHTSFSANPTCLDIQGNTVLDPVDNLAVFIQTQGPITFLDNTIRSRSGATGPVVQHSSYPSDVVFFSAGNTFTVASPVSLTWYIVWDNAPVDRSTLLGLTLPSIPATPQNQSRTVYEVSGFTGASIQSAINAAVAGATTRPIVHMAHGEYDVSSTITIPANSDVQLVGDGDGDGHSTELHWTGGASTVLNILGPTKATLRDFYISGNNVASDVVVTNSDQVGARVFAHQLESHSNQINILYDGNNTKAIAVNSGFSNSPKSISVSGGGELILYGCAQSNNDLSHEVTDSGHLLIRDIWYESHLGNVFLEMSGIGNFYLDGTRIANLAVMPDPQFHINNVVGNVTLLNSFLSDYVSITGNGSETNFLGMSLLSGHDTYLNNTSSPSANVKSYNRRAVDPDQNTSGSGSYSTSNVGDPADDFRTQIEANLAYIRSVHAPSIGSTGAGVTDLRIYRVWLTNGVNGLEIQDDGTDPPPDPPSGQFIITVPNRGQGGVIKIKVDRGLENSIKLKPNRN